MRNISMRLYIAICFYRMHLELLKMHHPEKISVCGTVMTLLEQQQTHPDEIVIIIKYISKINEKKRSTHPISLTRMIINSQVAILIGNSDNEFCGLFQENVYSNHVDTIRCRPPDTWIINK